MDTIQTPYGKRTVNRVVGCYVETLPRPNEPHGAWWTLNPQRGYVPVPSNARGLRDALRAHRAAEACECEREAIECFECSQKRSAERAARLERA